MSIDTFSKTVQSTLPTSFKPTDFDDISSQVEQRQRLESAFQSSGVESLPQILNIKDTPEAKIGEQIATNNTIKFAISTKASSTIGSINGIINQAIESSKPDQGEPSILGKAGKWIGGFVKGIKPGIKSVISALKKDIKTGAVAADWKYNFALGGNTGNINLNDLFASNSEHILNNLQLDKITTLPEQKQKEVINAIQEALENFKATYEIYIKQVLDAQNLKIKQEDLLNKFDGNQAEETVKGIKLEQIDLEIKAGNEGFLKKMVGRAAIAPLVASGLGFGITGAGAVITGMFGRSLVAGGFAVAKEGNINVAKMKQQVAIESITELVKLKGLIEKSLQENPTQELISSLNNLITTTIVPNIHLLTGKQGLEMRTAIDEIQDVLTKTELEESLQEPNKDSNTLIGWVKEVATNIKNKLTVEIQQKTKEIKALNWDKAKSFGKHFALASAASVAGFGAGWAIREFTLVDDYMSGFVKNFKNDTSYIAQAEGINAMASHAEGTLEFQELENRALANGWIREDSPNGMITFRDPNIDQNEAVENLMDTLAKDAIKLKDDVNFEAFSNPETGEIMEGVNLIKADKELPNGLYLGNQGIFDGDSARQILSNNGEPLGFVKGHYTGPDGQDYLVVVNDGANIDSLNSLITSGQIEGYSADGGFWSGIYNTQQWLKANWEMNNLHISKDDLKLDLSGDMYADLETLSQNLDGVDINNGLGGYQLQKIVEAAEEGNYQARGVLEDLRNNNTSIDNTLYLFRPHGLAKFGPKKLLEIFSESDLKDLKTFGINPDDGLSIDEFNELKIKAFNDGNYEAKYYLDKLGYQRPNPTNINPTSATTPTGTTTPTSAVSSATTPTSPSTSTTVPTGTTPPTSAVSPAGATAPIEPTSTTASTGTAIPTTPTSAVSPDSATAAANPIEPSVKNTFENTGEINNGVQINISSGASPEEIAKLTAPLQQELENFNKIMEDFGDDGSIEGAEATEILANYPNLPTNIQEQLKLIETSGIPAEITLNRGLLEITSFEPLSISSQHLNPREILRFNIDPITGKFNIDDAIADLEAEMNTGSGIISTDFMNQLNQMKDSGQPITVGNGQGEFSISTRIPETNSLDLTEIENKIAEIEKVAGSGGGNVNIGNINNNSNLINGDGNEVNQNNNPVETNPIENKVTPVETPTETPETEPILASSTTTNLPNPTKIRDNILGLFKEEGLGGWNRVTEVAKSMSLPNTDKEYSAFIDGLNPEQQENLVKQLLKNRINDGSFGILKADDEQVEQILEEVEKSFPDFTAQEVHEMALKGDLRSLTPDAIENLGSTMEGFYSETAGKWWEMFSKSITTKDFEAEFDVFDKDGNSVEVFIDSSHDSDSFDEYESNSDYKIFTRGPIKIAIKDSSLDEAGFVANYESQVLEHLREEIAFPFQDDINISKFGSFFEGKNGVYAIDADTKLSDGNTLDTIFVKGHSGQPILVDGINATDSDVKLFLVGKTEDGKFVFATENANYDEIKALADGGKVELYSNEGGFKWPLEGATETSTTEPSTTATTSTEGTTTETTTPEEITPASKTPATVSTTEETLDVVNSGASFDESFKNALGVSTKDYLNLSGDEGANLMAKKLQEVGIENVDPSSLDQTVHGLATRIAAGETISAEEARQVLVNNAGLDPQQHSTFIKYWEKAISSNGLTAEEEQAFAQESVVAGHDGIGDQISNNINFGKNDIEVKIDPEKFPVYGNKEWVKTWEGNVGQYSSLVEGGINQEKANALMEYMSTVKNGGAQANGEMLQKVISETNRILSAGGKPEELNTAIEAITGQKIPEGNAFFDAVKEAIDPTEKTDPAGWDWKELAFGDSKEFNLLKAAGAIAIVGGIPAVAFSAISKYNPKNRNYYTVAATVIPAAIAGLLVPGGAAYGLLAGASGWFIKDKLDKTYFSPDKQENQTPEGLPVLNDKNYDKITGEVQKELNEADKLITQAETDLKTYFNTVDKREATLAAKLLQDGKQLETIGNKLLERKAQFGNTTDLKDSAKKTSAKTVLDKINIKIGEIQKILQQLPGATATQEGQEKPENEQKNPDLEIFNQIKSEYEQNIQQWNNLSDSQRQNLATQKNFIDNLNIHKTKIKELQDKKPEWSVNLQTHIDLIERTIAKIKNGEKTQQPANQEGTEGELTDAQFNEVANALTNFIDANNQQTKTIAANSFVTVFKRNIGSTENPDGSANPKYAKYFNREVDRYAPIIKQRNPTMSDENARQEARRRLGNHIGNIDSLVTSSTPNQNNPQNQQIPSTPNNQPNQQSNERELTTKIDPNRPDLRLIRGDSKALSTRIETTNTSISHTDPVRNLSGLYAINPDAYRNSIQATISNLHALVLKEGGNQNNRGLWSKVVSMFGRGNNNSSDPDPTLSPELNSAIQNAKQIFRKLGLEPSILQTTINRPETIKPPDFNTIKEVESLIQDLEDDTHTGNFDLNNLKMPFSEFAHNYVRNYGNFVRFMEGRVGSNETLHTAITKFLSETVALTSIDDLINPVTNANRAFNNNNDEIYRIANDNLANLVDRTLVTDVENHTYRAPVRTP